MTEINYVPGGPTLCDFHASDCRRRGIMGPVGSGKSFAGLAEIFRRACETPPAPNGTRYSRFAVIRRTFGDLDRTTIVTYKKLFADAFGTPVRRQAGFVHDIGFALDDGTRVECEVVFFSMMREDDIARLMSLELTGAFINEARELPKGIFDALDDRISRYPDKHLGGDGAWFGWWFDTNPPDTDHWMYRTFEVERPKGWELFRQPGGVIRCSQYLVDTGKNTFIMPGDRTVHTYAVGDWMPNPLAENIHNHNLGMGYYIEAMSGKKNDHIKVYYGADWGYVQEGRLIIPDFNDQFHTATSPLEYNGAVDTIFVGIDFGTTPAAAFFQQQPNGQWYLVEEVINPEGSLGAASFCRTALLPRLSALSGEGFKFVITGDPAGNQTSQTDAKTPFKVLKDNGVMAKPAYTNDFGHRIEVISNLCRQVIDGEPAFVLSPACPVFRKGINQKYAFIETRKDDDAAGVVYRKAPLDNDYSHIVDAAQYALMGAGLGREIGKKGLHGDEIERRMRPTHRSQPAIARI